MIAALWGRFGGWLFVALAVAFFGYGLWKEGIATAAAEKACRAQFSEEITRQTRETLAAQIRDQALANNRLRAQQDALIAERNAAIRQKEQEKAAKWRARSELNAVKATPAGADFLQAQWPDGPDSPASWVCGSTGFAAACLDENGSRSAGDTSGTPEADRPLRDPEAVYERADRAVLQVKLNDD